MNDKRVAAKKEKLESSWARIRKIANAPLYDALREFAGIFDGTAMIEWIAGLWDNDVGGFYYSNSARDNDGFLPDLESTGQAVTILESSHAANCKRNDFLPDEMKAKIIDFVRGLQSAEDGYFYHPQWPCGKENLRSDRYGRDLGWATGLLKMLTVDRDGDGVSERQYPFYCTPSGMKCELHDGTDEVCACISSMQNKAPAAVKKQYADSVETPDLSSPEGFEAWIRRINCDIKTKPWLAAHHINCTSSEIFNKNYTPILLDYLEEIQDEVYEEQMSKGEKPTGFWAYNVDYALTMSIHKYFAFFNHPTQGREFKYYKEALDTMLDIIMLDSQGNKGLNDLMNQWISLGHLVTNVKKYHPEDVADMYELVRKRGAELLKRTVHNLSFHRLDDGTFVYYKGNSMSVLYGTEVSKGVPEADLNGYLLLCNLYGSVFSSMDLPIVPLCTSEDGDNFLELTGYKKC